MIRAAIAGFRRSEVRSKAGSTIITQVYAIQLPTGDIAPEATTHDSDYVGSRGMGGRSYRRSREQGEQLRRNLHYGQYLEIPKGRRDIFVSRERKSRRRSLIACIVVLAILAVVVFFLWEFMSSTWGAVR